MAETLEEFAKRTIEEWHDNPHGIDSIECLVARAVERRTAERCLQLARIEGAVPREEGGNLSRMDGCDNVANDIRKEFHLDAE